MSDYTPTLDDIETLVRAVFVQGAWVGEFPEELVQKGMENFHLVIESVKAEAWDEGAAKAWGHGIETYLTPGFTPYSIRRQNPYRKETTDGCS